MKKFCIIIFLGILFCANTVFADETKRIYNNQGNATGYVITDNNGNKIYYNNSWDRIGHSINRGDTDINYDKDYSRSGKIVWDGDTGTEFDGAGNRIGHLRKEGDRIIFFDKGWNRQGYKR